MARFCQNATADSKETDSESSVFRKECGFLATSRSRSRILGRNSENSDRPDHSPAGDGREHRQTRRQLVDGSSEKPGEFLTGVERAHESFADQKGIHAVTAHERHVGRGGDPRFGDQQAVFGKLG